MAVFGDLANIAPPELLRMLERRTGRLHLRPGDDVGGDIELHLDGGTVRDILVGGAPLGGGDAPSDAIRRVLRLQRGTFHFEAARADDLTPRFAIPRSEVLRFLASLESDADEADEEAEDDGRTATSGRIPAGETRFTLADASPHDLDGDLHRFFRCILPQLRSGCSADEAAGETGATSMRARIYFKRLRELGKIAPVRAHATLHGAAPGSADPRAATANPTGSRGSRFGRSAERGSLPRFSAPAGSAAASTRRPSSADRAAAGAPARRASVPERTPASAAAAGAPDPSSGRRGLVRRLLAAIAPGGSR